MSRLIVKNLPKSIKEDKIREVFSEKGVVTDVQLKYTKEGKFRQFGFVGFKTKEQAREALDYFNNTCINASRINIALCADLGDPNKPKAWSKYASDSSAYKKQHGEPTKPDKEIKEKGNQEEKLKGAVIQDKLAKHKDDPLFREFMDAHAKDKKVWSNDLMSLNNSAISVGTDTNKSYPKALDDPGFANEGNVDSADDEDDDDENDDDEDDDNNSSHKTMQEEERKKNVAKKDISDLEYLKIKTVKPRKVANEEGTADMTNSDVTFKKKVKKRKPKQGEFFFTIIIRGMSVGARKRDVKQFLQPLKPVTIRLPRNIRGVAYAGFKTEQEMKKALIRNKSFLAGRQLAVTKCSSKNEVSSGLVGSEQVKMNPGGHSWKNQEEGLKKEESVGESGRIFVRNLSYTVTEDDLTELFKQYGPVAEVTMPIDMCTRKPKGFAIVTFMIPENASSAYMALDGSAFHGRMLHLLPGKAQRSSAELLESEGLTFKQKRVLLQRSRANSSHNWNTLFLGQNAVADIIAEAYDTTKEKVLDSSGKESVAVRLALGETQIVAQVREFLESSGVRLDAFNQAPKERSKTAILLKNLPAKTSAGEMEELFQKFGVLSRVVLPPTGVTGIVEFAEPYEARNAFKRLAYSKFKHMPLYLEWAPADTFTQSAPMLHNSKSEHRKEDEDTSSAADAELPKDDAELPKDDADFSDVDDVPEPDSTLFVKNLNFKTSKEALLEHFRKCGHIHNVTVATKKDLSNVGQLLSMGYGFVQFKAKAGADKALKTMQHSVLDGYSLELKRSNRTVSSEVKTARKKTNVTKQTGTKILVRNIPFQANKTEIMTLFQTFGEIKDLRLPKKMVGTGPHRGFAFVDYQTKHEAKRAFKALCQSTHLYGRRLVLEWTAAEDTVEELRKRTAEQFSFDQQSSRNLKKATFDPELDDE